MSTDNALIPCTCGADRLPDIPVAPPIMIYGWKQRHVNYLMPWLTMLISVLLEINLLTQLHLNDKRVNFGACLTFYSKQE